MRYFSDGWMLAGWAARPSQPSLPTWMFHPSACRRTFSMQRVKSEGILITLTLAAQPVNMDDPPIVACRRSFSMQRVKSEGIIIALTL